MDYYTNEASLKTTYGEVEASGLMQGAGGVESNVRLEKAAAQSYAEINEYLGAAGYVVPLTFTPFGYTGEDPAPAPLHAVIQGISDCFTAFTLAATADLQKKQYNECRAMWLAWLERVATGQLTLSLDLVGDSVAGIVVKSRSKVFNTEMKPENAVFGRRT